MNKETIIDNDLLKKEIKALNDYVSRDECNLNVVEVMLSEIQDMVKRLKPCEQKSDFVSNVTCPFCNSRNVEFLNSNMFFDPNYFFYFECKDCKKPFSIPSSDFLKQEDGVKL